MLASKLKCLYLTKQTFLSLLLLSISVVVKNLFYLLLLCTHLQTHLPTEVFTSSTQQTHWIPIPASLCYRNVFIFKVP